MVRGGVRRRDRTAGGTGAVRRGIAADDRAARDRGHGFFFQADDGIRGPLVTGVQTCALPILALHPISIPQLPSSRSCARTIRSFPRSEERRVGKECRTRWSPPHYKKNTR